MQKDAGTSPCMSLVIYHLHKQAITILKSLQRYEKINESIYFAKESNVFYAFLFAEPPRLGTKSDIAKSNCNYQASDVAD